MSGRGFAARQCAAEETLILKGDTAMAYAIQVHVTRNTDSARYDCRRYCLERRCKNYAMSEQVRRANHATEIEGGGMAETPSARPRERRARPLQIRSGPFRK
jgi:hypothetical protein